MQPIHARLRSGSRAETQTGTDAGPASDWEQEWRKADAAERDELELAWGRRRRRALAMLAPTALLAGLIPAIFPFTPGFAAADTAAAVGAAVLAATVSVAFVPIGDRLARGLPGAGAGDLLVFAVALLSAGAAAIHFAVAKTHFEEYVLFGVFFVGSALGQVVLPIWLMLWRWRPLLVLGAVGNGLIAALWGVDRIWGLPLGPTPWKPDPVGFADSAASAFELLLALGCIALLIRAQAVPLRRSSVVALTLAVATVTTLSLLSVLGVGSSFLTPTE